MAIRTRKLNQTGYTLIEMAIATVVMAVMATTVILANRFVNKQAVANADRTFASEKAIQMYEELRALVSGNEQLGVGVLDNYSDFSNYNYVLTTDTSVNTGLSTANPGDPISGNFKSDGNWRYLRQVAVNRVGNDTQARQVTVKVFLYPGDNIAAGKPGVLLATVGGILRTSALPNVATQVMDLYILQINSIPSWWSVLPTLASYMQADVSDLESRLQGVQLRTHYITRTSYGRDYYYQPETNSFANPTESTHQQWAYFYPGITPQDSGGDFWYFDPQTSGDPNSLLMDGNVMVDGVSYPISTSQFNNTATASYSIADQYNNAMRYPDEMAAYQGVTAAAAQAIAAGAVVAEGVTEISERMLFEGMLSKPASFANAIIVNLHGELLPLPPMRNYSDAAKDPGNQLSTTTNPAPMMCPITVTSTSAPPVTFVGNTNVRVVTHPELLYYPGQTTTSTAVTVRLRVYAYYDGEDTGGLLPTGDPRVPAISLFFPDSKVTLLGVTAEIGNSLTSGVSCHYARVALSSPYTGNVPGDVTASGASGPMNLAYTTLGPNTNQTLITLFNTPLRAGSGPVSGASGSTTYGGLNSGDKLYGSEYIPSSPELTTASAPTSATYVNNTYTFTNEDLASPDQNLAGNPCNTARWIITVSMPISQVYASGLTIYSGGYAAPATMSGIHAIETRLGNGVTTSAVTIGGVASTIYPNLSRTYVWTGDAFMPPYTEQYQFLGDPRDCPYLDVKIGGPPVGNAAITIGPNAYNWWFKGTGTAGMATDGYVGFGQAGVSVWSGNGGGDLQVDLPRYYQIIRQGLLNTTSIWTGTNGWSWFYFGIGGEYGSDQSPRSSGIQMLDDLFRTSGTGTLKNFNDLYAGDGTDGGYGNGLFVVSNTNGSNSINWYQRSWLGELYPDKSYLTSWVPYGNLPSIANTTITAANKPETFYLKPMGVVGTAGGGGSDDGFAGDNFWVNPAGYGSEAFYNGKNTTTGKTFEHLGTDNSGTELALAVTTYNILPFPMPGVVDVNREWDFAGGTTPASVSPFYSAGMTTTIDIPTVTNATGGGVTSRLFYDYNQNGVPPITSPYGSGVVRMTNVSSGASPVTQVGYVVETGTAPSGNVGAQTLAETALVLGLRTFLDGGRMAADGVPGHIVQLPLVKIFLASSVPQYNESQGVSFTVGAPITATTNGGGAVSVGMPVTDIWWRFNPNGLANYYTEEYPQYNQPMTTQSGMYQESVSVTYNLKYSNNGGKTWYFVQDDAAAVTGVCDCNTGNPSPAGHAVTNLAPWTYNWPVSTGSRILSQGDYELMVEAYRQNYGLHYAYDIQDIEISW